MTTETDTYPDEATWRTALEGNRGGGWYIVSNSKIKLQITWSNDPPPPPTADEIKIKELKDKI